ncbi:hypothetical protein C8Q76DRAFT_456932 [Earliella scabrosa]|nr:hypothetical protein C8Q76DRAFT_456932 [Earliella scabrosa]
MRPTAPNVLFTPPPADILWLVVDAVVEPEYHLLAKFDNQARVRRATLHSCALVCKGMLHRAMYHLYNEVSLHDHWRASLFARTMAERRELAPLVKHLSLGLGQCLSEEEDDFRTPLPADVVVLLSNLNSLTLDGESDWPGMRPEALDFAKLFPASCPSLDKLVLTRLEFESFVDFVGLVWSFPRIRHLAMSRLFIPRTDGGMPVGGDDDLTKSLIESTRVNDLTTLIVCNC